MGERVPGSVRRQQIIETETAIIGRDGAALHRVARGIGAGQRQRYIVDRRLAGVTSAVIVVGCNARARVLIDEARQRRDALAEMVVGRPRRRQVGHRDRVGTRTARRIARIDAAVAITRRLGLTHRVGAAARRAGERIAARGVGLGACQGRAGTCGAGIQRQRDATQATIGRRVVNHVVAVAINVHRTADAGLSELAEQVATRLHAGTERDATDDIFDGDAAARAARRVLAVGKHARGRRDGTLRDGVAGCIRRNEIGKAELAIVVGDGRQVHGRTRRIGAGQRDRHGADARLAAIAHAIVEIGRHAGAGVLVDGTRQRARVLTEAIAA